MIKRILMDLRRVEDISETINIEIRNNIAKIKDSTNKMKNTLKGMNSRLEEAEKQISDLKE